MPYIRFLRAFAGAAQSLQLIHDPFLHMMTQSIGPIVFYRKTRDTIVISPDADLNGHPS